MADDPRQAHLERLRRWRTRREPDLGLGFLHEWFKRQVERPHRQLAAIAAAWEELVPAGLRSHTRLDSLSRGVLKVVVASSSALYELDRLLRGGLEAELIRRQKGSALRKVRLSIGAINDEQDASAPRPPAKPPPEEEVWEQ